MANPKEFYQKPTSEVYGSYIIPIDPAIDVTRLDTEVLVGSERSGLSILTAGTWSLVISYMNRNALTGSKPAFVLSVEDANSEVSIIQMQGTRKPGFRVSQGVKVVEFFADQLGQIVADPRNGYRRLTMPDLEEIRGLFDCATSEGIAAKHEQLIRLLDMSYSGEERKHIRELRNS